MNGLNESKLCSQSTISAFTSHYLFRFPLPIVLLMMLQNDLLKKKTKIIVLRIQCTAYSHTGAAPRIFASGGKLVQGSTQVKKNYPQIIFSPRISVTLF